MCDQHNGAIIGQCIREIQKITEKSKTNRKEIQNIQSVTENRMFFGFNKFYSIFLKTIFHFFYNFFYSEFVSGGFDSSGSMIPVSVSEILSVKLFVKCSSSRNWVF